MRTNMHLHNYGVFIYIYDIELYKIVCTYMFVFCMPYSIWLSLFPLRWFHWHRLVHTHRSWIVSRCLMHVDVSSALAIYDPRCILDDWAWDGDRCLYESPSDLCHFARWQLSQKLAQTQGQQLTQSKIEEPCEGEDCGHSSAQLHIITYHFIAMLVYDGAICHDHICVCIYTCTHTHTHTYVYSMYVCLCMWCNVM